MACGPSVVSGDAGTGDTTGGTAATEESGGPTGPVDPDTSSGEEDPGVKLDMLPEDCPDCGQLDVLFVIDNSSRTADLQLAFGNAMEEFVAELAWSPRDVQVMVTTTDVGNPLCTPFQHPDYAPAMGAAIATGCNQRINRFTGLGTDPEVRADVCTSLCPIDVMPMDPFVAFDTATGEHNVPGASAVEALRCLVPQGIDGCGFESPLEAMLLALSPAAAHNAGARPFLRPEAALAIVILTNEADCSIEDYSVMSDPSYWSIHPESQTPQASSALCWNAGVECTEATDGVFAECVPADGPLQPVARYRDLLAGLEDTGKRVTMLAIAGVPSVTQHDAEPPHAPIAGGLLDLVYREWTEDDLFTEEIDAGTPVEQLAWEFGIGPACAIEDAGVRGIPNPRLFDVCQSLDEGLDTRCCLESVCDDPSAGLRCLVGTHAPDGGGWDESG